MVTYIEVTYTVDALWGSSDPADGGYDQEESHEKYAQIVIDEVHKHYSNAVVRVELGSVDEISVHGEDADEILDAEAVVNYVCERVWNEGDWYVYVPEGTYGYEPERGVDNNDITDDPICTCEQAGERGCDDSE